MAKITMGSIVRLTSFAHKPAEGEPVGLFASPEAVPEEEKDVFLCMLLGKEKLKREDWSEETEEVVIHKALNSLGYYRVEDVIAMGGKVPNA